MDGRCVIVTMSTVANPAKRKAAELSGASASNTSTPPDSETRNDPTSSLSAGTGPTTATPSTQATSGFSTDKTNAPKKGGVRVPTAPRATTLSPACASTPALVAKRKIKNTKLNGGTGATGGLAKRVRPSVPRFSQDPPSQPSQPLSRTPSLSPSPAFSQGEQRQLSAIGDPILCLRNVGSRTKVCPLDPKKQTVFVAGRNAHVVDIILRGDRVSRKHAELRWESATGSWRLFDLSMAGVWVNTKRIPKGSNAGYSLRLQDKICFGYNSPALTFVLDCWTSPVARLVVVQSDQTGLLTAIPAAFNIDARSRRRYAIGASSSVC